MDASDIVQETLVQATLRLSSFQDQPEEAFYPWLRKIALNTLTDNYRKHFLAEGRSVLREAVPDLHRPSLEHLAENLATAAGSPSKIVRRRERLRRACHLASILPMSGKKRIGPLDDKFRTARQLLVEFERSLY